MPEITSAQRKLEWLALYEYCQEQEDIEIKQPIRAKALNKCLQRHWRDKKRLEKKNENIFGELRVHKRIF